MKTTKILAAAIVAMLFFAGCLGDPVNPEAKASYIAVIVNNGNDKNGSVNYYNEESDKISLDPFEYKFNATYRSIQLVDDRLCLVTNDDDAIVLFDILGRQIGAKKTDNIATPRFITANTNYLFVSNWGAETGGEYHNSFVSIFNKFDLSFVKKLDCGSKAEGVVAHKDRLFVATAAGVEVFNTLSADFLHEATLTASTLTGDAKRLVVDSLDNVWASYSGGGLLCINPTMRAIVREFPNVPVDAETGAITISKNGIVSYGWMINPPVDIVVVTDLTTGEYTNLIQGNYNITALGVSPFTDNIYIAHTPPNGESTLLVFDETGVKKSEKQTGVHTGHIAFFGYYYY